MTIRTKPSLSALMSAGVGAALFLGIGAALPVWERTEIIVGERAPLYEVIRLRVTGADRYRYLGYMIYEPGYGDLIAGSLRLLACGAFAGLLGYVAWRLLKRRAQKDGEP